MHVPYSFSYNIDKIAKLELACQHNYIICQPYFGNKTNFMVTNLTAIPFLSVKNCFLPNCKKKYKYYIEFKNEWEFKGNNSGFK